MKLTGQHKKILRQGILGAYPNKEALQILLAEEMDVSFEEIARGNDYSTQVFNLIQDFESRGELEEFIAVLVRNRPNSPMLEEIRRELNRG